MVDISIINSNRDSQWFVNGKCNILDNVLDRKLKYSPTRLHIFLRMKMDLIQK